jgi:hypothetical protein
MTIFPDVQCANDAFRDRIVHWLEQLNLPWPQAIVFKVQNGPAPNFQPDDRAPLRDRNVEVRLGPPGESVRISSREMDAESEVDATAGVVTIWMSEDAVARFERVQVTFLMFTIIFLLRRVSWYHVHGACLIDPRGRGWLFVGNSKGGKSTTTALLMRQGWTLVTDDVGFLDAQTGRATLAGGSYSAYHRASTSVGETRQDSGPKNLGEVGPTGSPRKSSYSLASVSARPFRRPLHAWRCRPSSRPRHSCCSSPHSLSRT